MPTAEKTSCNLLTTFTISEPSPDVAMIRIGAGEGGGWEMRKGECLKRSPPATVQVAQDARRAPSTAPQPASPPAAQTNLAFDYIPLTAPHPFRRPTSSHMSLLTKMLCQPPLLRCGLAQIAVHSLQRIETESKAPWKLAERSLKRQPWWT